MKRMLLDLETLALDSRAVVTAIGIVIFDEIAVWQGQLILPRVQPQLNMGRSFRWDTFVWWLEKSEEARREISVLDINRAPVADALDQLTHAFKSNEVQEVWGNGSSFDVSIMETLYADVGGPTPWSHKQVRDLRTLASLLPGSEDLRPSAEEGSSVHHSAVDDAYRQAIWAQRILKGLNQREESE